MVTPCHSADGLLVRCAPRPLSEQRPLGPSGTKAFGSGCPGWLRLTWPHAYCLMPAGPGAPDTIGAGSSGGWLRPRSGPGAPSPAAGHPRWEGEQARTSDNERPDWRVPQRQSGSEPQKETGESHRRRSTHHGVAEVAARKWLSSWPPATVGAGIRSSHWSVLACDSIARSRAPPRQSGEVPSSKRSVPVRLRPQTCWYSTYP